MEKIRIKNTDMFVSRLCFGGCPMGGHGWGKTSRENFIESIHRALDIGINFFDTADVYGLGEAEEILGEALRNRRKDVIIATKFGVRFKNGKSYYDNSPEWIERALENSLKRLKTSYIDIYQIHYRDNKTPLNKIIDKLEELRLKGKIRYYGLSNIKIEDYEKLKQFKNYFVSLQNEFSLSTRKNQKDILKLCSKMELTPMTWGSLGQGILTGKYNEDSIFLSDDRRSRIEYENFHGKKFKHNLKIVEYLRKISKKYQKSISSVAIRWILDYIPNSVVITGIKNISQLEMNASSLNWKLKKDDLTLLDKISSGDYNE